MITVADALNIALTHHRAGRLAEARAVYERILEADATNVATLNLLALCVQNGDPDRAAGLYARALGVQPELPELRHNLAGLLHQTGQSDAALARLRECVALRPDYADALHKAGLVTHAVGGPRLLAHARRHIGRALAVRPDLAPVRADLGVLLRQGGQAEQAVRQLGAAVATAPDLFVALLNLGSALMAVGRTEEAAASYRRAARLDPRSPAAAFNLGSAFYALGRLDEAAAAFRQAAGLGHAEALLKLGGLLAGTGHPEEAERVLRAALATPGLDAGEALELLGTLLIRQGRHEELRRDLATFANTPIGQNLRGEGLTVLGASLLDEGRLDEACHVLGRVQGARSRLFTVRSVAFLRRSLRELGGSPPVRRNGRGGRERISGSSLATHGRFAHTVLEYALLRLYAESRGLDLETPDWAGHYVFELDDPAIADPPLPIRPFSRPALIDAVAGRPAPDLAGCDLPSPLGLHEHGEEHRARIQSWLRVRPVWRPMLDPVTDALAARGRTVIALHLRRGDFLAENYPISETRWYVDWLRTVWDSLDAPVLYLASDDIPAVKADFAAFAPLSLDDLHPGWNALEFLQDFHVLMNADVVGVSAASGFSRLAALLNRRARLFVEPDVATGRIHPFAPWRPAAE